MCEEDVGEGGCQQDIVGRAERHRGASAPSTQLVEVEHSSPSVEIGIAMCTVRDCRLDRRGVFISYCQNSVWYPESVAVDHEGDWEDMLRTAGQ